MADDTAAVMTLEKPFADPEVALLRCEMPSGECEVAVEGLSDDLQLPIGETLSEM